MPPHAQASLATSAAAEGKHLLLEKPIALDVAAARLLEDAIIRAGVKSAVFFTACYTIERRAWVKDLVHLVLGHDGGATSTATLTLQAKPVAGAAEVSVWGTDGVRRMPHSAEPVEATLARALSELKACAAADTTHRLDVSFGRHVVELLADAERLADAGGPSGPQPSPS